MSIVIFYPCLLWLWEPHSIFMQVRFRNLPKLYKI